MHRRTLPIIGITLDCVSNSEKCRYASSPWYALRQNYMNAVIKFGAIPLAIPYQPAAIENIIEHIDGLIIPGGEADIHPKYYQEPMNGSTEANDERDEYEYKILKATLKKNLPFLGICRGMQMLNIVCGGSLIQDIQTYFAENRHSISVVHEQGAPKDRPSHSINIIPNTILSQLAAGDLDTLVNSTHHQAVKQLGEGLIISSLAQDGIIESIESINHEFVMGVEWHPEYLHTKLDHKIFQTFIQTASNRAIKFS